MVSRRLSSLTQRARSGSVLCAVALTLSLSSPASAGDKEAAEGLFQAGRALMSQQRYADACPKFAEAYGLAPGVGIQFNLADCYEKQGKLASAWINYHEVLSKLADSDQRERISVARERLASIEPRLTKLVIEPQEPVEGMTIKRGETVVGQAQWRVPIAVDPGSYWIEAGAPGKAKWRMQVAVEGEGTSTKVTIPPLTDAPTAEGADEDGAAVVEEPDQPRDGAAQSTAGLVIAGVGLVGVVVGAIFGGVALSKKDEAEPHCPQPTSCYDPGADLLDEAQTAGTISTAAFIAGGVLLAGGVVLWLTAPSASHDEIGALTISPQIGPGLTGVSLQASW